MGHKFEVYAWIEVKHMEFEYQEMYAGQSLIKALATAWWLRHNGVGCVKIEWR